jgi:RNA chaperone Hfq
LDSLCAEGGFVVIFTLNGSRITGRISGFDANTVLIQSDVLKLVYKSSIASILPDSPDRETRT